MHPQGMETGAEMPLSYSIPPSFLPLPSLSLPFILFMLLFCFYFHWLSLCDPGPLFSALLCWLHSLYWQYSLHCRWPSSSQQSIWPREILGLYHFILRGKKRKDLLCHLHLDNSQKTDLTCVVGPS